MALSSRGLGRRSLKAETRVRIPLRPHMFRSLYLKISFISVFLIVLIISIMTAAIFPNPKSLILFPQTAGNSLKPISFLYELCLFIFALLIINFSLAYYFFFKEKIISIFLGSASLLEGLIILVYFLKVISLN